MFLSDKAGMAGGPAVGRRTMVAATAALAGIP